MERNKKTEEVFESIKGMHRAEPSPFIFEQVTEKILKGNTKPSFYGSSFLRWGLAVFVSVMISLNIISLLNERTFASEISSEKATFADSYFNNETAYTY